MVVSMYEIIAKMKMYRNFIFLFEILFIQNIGFWLDAIQSE